MYLVLASKSPRRKEILSKAGYNFKIDVSDVDENVEEVIPVEKVQAIAKKKGLAVYSRYNDSDVVILSADTIVVIGDEILGKPKDKEDARRMINLLQGKTHQVYTGVFIKSIYGEDNFVEKTDVSIKPMTDEEIEEYISIKEPYDKAGSYAIQGVFSKYIGPISGDYYNVMGLPINKVNEVLKKYNFTESYLGLSEEVPNIKICSKCGKTNNEKNKYCMYCGSELVDSDTPIQVPGECPICHHVNQPSSMYCEICGTILNKNDPVYTQPNNINQNVDTKFTKGKDFAIPGIVLGVTSIALNFLLFTSFLAVVAGILAIVFSAMSLKGQNSKYARTGLITGIIGTFVAIVFIVFLLSSPAEPEAPEYGFLLLRMLIK